MTLPGTQTRLGLLGCLLALGSLAAILIVVLIVVAAVPSPLALLVSITAASIPALVYAWIVLRLDRYEVEPRRAIIACFAWGAVGAVLFSIIASVVFQRTLARYLDEQSMWFAQAALGAPLIEESFKGIAVLVMLLVARDEVDNVLDGLVYGALIGVGFAMTENILYFGQGYLEEGLRGFRELVLARAVLSGLLHPATTAVTGAAIGWSRAQYGRGFARFVVPIAGWAIAVALHMAWNGGLFFTGYRLGDDAGLVQAVAIQTVIVIVPAVAVLYAIARNSRRYELAILRTELRSEVERGALTEDEYQTVIDGDRRRQALAAARTRGGRALWGKQQAFFHTAAELAFRRHHRGQGEPEHADGATRDENDRRRLATLRDELDE